MLRPADSPVSRALAVKYGLPAALVDRMLRSERDLLSREARVTRYIPILAERRLEERLQAGERGRPPGPPQARAT